MNLASVLRLLRDLWHFLLDGLWAGVALLFDVGRDAGPLSAGLVVLVLAGLSFIAALGLQRRLVHQLSTDPEQPISLFKLDLWFTLPGLLLQPVRALYHALRRFAHWLVSRFHRRTNSEAGKSSEAKPYLVATLGPSYLMAALLLAMLYLIGRLADPFLVRQLALTPGSSAWQFLLLGHRPELAPYLPLGRHPFFAAALTFFLGWVAWSWLARAVRFAYGRHLARSLLDQRQDAQTLRPWREWFAVRDLVQPARPYRRWATRLVVAAFPLLTLSWFSLANEPYRIRGSELTVALLLWLSWVLHLRLRGAEHQPEIQAEDDATLATVEAAGWEAVLADLERRLQVGSPLPCQPSRPVEPLTPSPHRPKNDPLLSPLLWELFHSPLPLTPMQHHELQRLARLGHVFTEPPDVPGELTLSTSSEREEGFSFERIHNRIVLAPEGEGKTTLGWLAASNHALLHTRPSLIVLPNRYRAEETYRTIHRHLEPSTLRWTLRLRRLGPDLDTDLTQGILPDLLVCDLESMVLNLLDRPEAYGPFLRRLGLIVVDDADGFLGPPEVHAQLAFRRLRQFAAAEQGIEELGEESAPMFLILATDCMHQTAAWIRVLCGIDAEERRYGYSQRESLEREAAIQKAQGEVAEQVQEEQDPAELRKRVESGLHQRFYRLADFRKPDGERLTAGEIIGSCERLAVPWHFRICGGQQHPSGRKALLLDEEPEYLETAAEACVIFLQGPWSAVRRELERLRRAGLLFTRWRRPDGGVDPENLEGVRQGAEPTALITLADPDEEMAFTQRDDRSELASLLRTLPHPVLRPPVPLASDTHLSSDLTQRWIEVGDLTRVYGHRLAPRLRALAQEDLLLVQERTEVNELAYRYEPRVYVRALATAVAQGDAPESADLLPRKVAQVELTSERVVRLFDRMDMSSLGILDADSAPFRYYPGRLFTTDQGRYIVTGQARESDTEEERPGFRRGDILVEPTLMAAVSSPRRSFQVEVLQAGTAGERRPSYGPDPVILGDAAIAIALHPIRVTAEHLATYRLAPFSGEVMARSIYDGTSRVSLGPLETEALCLYPNPGHRRNPDAEVPRLDLRAARLIAAAMRLVLPSLYRGAEEGIEVALVLRSEAASPEERLGPEDGFFLFDLHSGGNGTARALYRDSVEPLLRLVRLVIERVLAHGRLLALHDQSIGSEELSTEPEVRGTTRRAHQQDLVAMRRKQEEAVRHSALAWLDSRLRPEGGPVARADDRSFERPEYSESGEGDLIDIGRCWYSRDGTVSDLLWVKHRWRLASGGEAMLDAGFDRRTAEESRFFTEESAVLAGYQHFYREHLASDSCQLPDGTIWGAPRTVWYLDPESEKLESSGDPSGDDSIRSFHELASAVAAHSWLALSPLAGKLSQESSPGTADAIQRYELATYLSRFVQAIPYSIPLALRRGLRPPVSTLLFRRGDCDSKSLLLALLLKHCGIEAGLFVSFQERHAMVAAALPQPGSLASSSVTVHRDGQGRFSTEQEAMGKAEHYLRGKQAAQESHHRIEAWRKEVGLPQPVPIWAELPVSPKEETGGETKEVHLYVPIESTVYRPAGDATVAAPTSWTFLPLTAIWRRLVLAEGPPAADTVEQEVLS